MDLRLIIDHKDARPARIGHSAGNRIAMRVPRPSGMMGLSAAIRPPIAWMRPREIARPSPLPAATRSVRVARKKGSNTRCRSVRGMPGPSSSTTRTHRRHRAASAASPDPPGPKTSGRCRGGSRAPGRAGRDRGGVPRGPVPGPGPRGDRWRARRAARRSRRPRLGPPSPGAVWSAGSRSVPCRGCWRSSASAAPSPPLRSAAGHRAPRARATHRRRAASRSRREWR